MCYGHSSWFEAARKKELRKAQEKIDALNKQPATPPPATPSKAPAKQVSERDKVPA